MIRLVGILVLVLAAYAYPAEALLLPPHITSPSTAHGTTGTPFSYQITATNSPTSYGASGLPSWAGINTSTGAITGTPTATGTSIIRLSATNAAGTRTALLILTIAAGLSAPVVTSPSTAHGTTGTPFSYQITATNSPNSYGASGLPSWASVNTSTGTITGTPDAAATTSATISATNASGTGTGPLSITISPALPPAPFITSSNTASGTVGVPFSYSITATNSPTSYGATGLPSWAGINTSTGAITDTPTATGTSNITLSATNAAGTGTALLTLTIAAGLSAPVVTSPSTAYGTTGTPFSYQITATNSPNSYGASGLPSWAGINTSTGAITGTPTATGTSNITLSATNAAGTGTALLTLTIAAGLSAPVVNSPTTSAATVGTAFFYRITATNNPTSYNAAGLPTGLSIDTSSGYITGTPTGTGTSNITISASNAGGTGTGPVSLAVSAVGGLLHVPTGNTRYFALPNGQAIYLTGNHTWTSGISYANPGPFSFTAMVDYMQTINVNLIRHWDEPALPVNPPYGNVTTPLPFNRSGTCCASDGGNKFDLTSYNQAFFDALKSDVEYAASKGMYIMPMLIGVGEYDQTNFTTWSREYWNGTNNINGTTTDYFSFIEGTDTTSQNIVHAYLNKFLDTLATEPNVIYETANELYYPNNNDAFYAWQEGITDYVHSYEASQGYLHHLVGIEYYNTSRVYNTPADFVIPVTPQTTPPVANFGKPAVHDTDHDFGIGGGTDWWWSAFMNGNNLLSMDDMHGTGLSGNLDLGNTTYDFYETQNRVAIQQTRTVATMVDMTAMVPRGDLSSTGYCLADTAGNMYIIYARSGVTVDLTAASGAPLKARWLSTANGSLSGTMNLTGGSPSQGFSSPFGGTPAALVITP